MRHRTSYLAIAASVLATLLLSVPAQAAQISVADEQREGAQILRSVKAGSRDCESLARTDFELVGEYSMGRMVGSTRAHEGMNKAISRMMGGQGEEGMHEVLGVRTTGCDSASLPEGLSGAMGVAGAMGMMGGGSGSVMGGGGSGSEMGGYAGSAEGAGGATGLARANGMHRGGGDWGGGGILLAILAAGLIVLAGGFFLRRPVGRQRLEEAPRDILARRFASGDIDGDEYESHLRALHGPAT